MSILYIAITIGTVVLLVVSWLDDKIDRPRRGGEDKCYLQKSLLARK